ncbi:MAG: hypothetical protein ACE5FG_07240 [Myxococcota bacterium]
MQRSTRLGLSIVIALLAGAACERQDPNAWHPYTHPETGFSVLFPTRPVESGEDTQTPFGLIQTYRIEAQKEGDPLRYRVRADHYPLTVLALGSTQGLLHARAKRHEAVVGAKLLSEEDIRFKEQPAKQLVYELADGGFELARVLLTPPVMYQLSVFSPTQQPEGPDVSRFFDSFELPPDETPEQAPEEAPAEP